MSEETERVYATVSEDLKKKVRVKAAKRDMSMSELLGEILEEKFGSEGNPKSPMTAD
jgi:plasmid stability protein